MLHQLGILQLLPVEPVKLGELHRGRAVVEGHHAAKRQPDTGQ
jgi:hypothetical protein